jgi:uncharacterized protein (TIGR03000 family)
MYAKKSLRFSMGVIALGALLAAVQARAGDEQGWPINHPTGSSSFPWNASDYSGYYEPAYLTQNIGTVVPSASAEKYAIHAHPMPMMKNTVDPTAVTVVAHVPENAQIWFDDKATTSKGKTRVFYYPNLAPGWKYSYTVRVAWVEDAKVVSQTQTFSVAPGDVHAIFLKRNDANGNAG